MSLFRLLTLGLEDFESEGEVGSLRADKVGFGFAAASAKGRSPPLPLALPPCVELYIHESAIVSECSAGGVRYGRRVGLLLLQGAFLRTRHAFLQRLMSCSRDLSLLQ